jgi:hypothetical protein
MCERWGFRRGFSVDWPRHKIGSKDFTRKSRGLIVKWNYLLPPSWDEQETPWRSGRRWWGRPRARTWCKTEGEDEGEFVEILTCGREWRRWPESEAAGTAAGTRRTAAQSWWLQQNRERKGDRDSMGTTSKRARERQNETRSTRRTRWCAHLRLVRNDGDGRARRSWRGVAGVTRRSWGRWRSRHRNRANHHITALSSQNKLHSGVRLHWKCTVSPEKLAGKFAEI